MVLQRFWQFLLAGLLLASSAFATIFGTVRGVVHDPQHRPISDATVQLKSATSDWTQTAQTDQGGGFSFSAVPVGGYLVLVKKNGYTGLRSKRRWSSPELPRCYRRD